MTMMVLHDMVRHLIKKDQTAPYLYMKQGKRNMKKRALHKFPSIIRDRCSIFTPESWAGTLLADREMQLFYAFILSVVITKESS
jgi:hypothetical protein